MHNPVLSLSKNGCEAPLRPRGSTGSPRGNAMTGGVRLARACAKSEGPYALTRRSMLAPQRESFCSSRSKPRSRW